MKLYKYWDNKNGHVLLFQCQALNILDADLMFKESCGIDVVKSPWVGLTIE